jgi:uroporphyrinogen-III synthase
VSELSGKRILVTRARAQSEGLVERLAQLGAVAVIFPTIEIAAMADPAALDRAIAHLDSYDWIIFTSVNAVEFFWQRFVALAGGQRWQAAGKEFQAFAGVKVAAIGPVTAQALRARGVTAAFVPPEYVAEAIVPGLGEVRGQRILLPGSEIARRALFAALQERGAFPEAIAVYRTLPAQPGSHNLADLAQGVDAATFTSSSTVDNFFELLGSRALELLQGAVIACIGPITAQTARSRGLRVAVTANVYTMEGLVAALLAYFQETRI